MDRLVIAGLTNAALAGLLAVVAVAATRAWRNPYFGRIAWLAVLLKLVTPPLLFVPIEAAWLQPIEEAQLTATTALKSEASRDNTQIIERTTSPTEGSRDVEANANNQPTDIASVAGTVTKPATTSARWRTSLASYLNLHWQDALTGLGVVWFGGSLVLGATALVRVWRFGRLVRSSPLAPALIAARADAIASRLGLRHTPRLCVVTGRLAPLAWNLGRQATVIIPAALVESLDEPALDAILAHEFTHIRRRDAWARWLELVAASLYWWCPVVWIARQRVREAEEQCCDADVLRMFPALRHGYGRALLQTLDLLAGERLIAPGASGWGTRRSLQRRFEQIAADVRPTPLRRRGRYACWGTIALLCLLAPTAVSSEPPAAEAAPPPDLKAAQPINLPQQGAATKLFSENHDDWKPCTITLDDGSRIQGILINDDEHRLVIERTKSWPQAVEAFKKRESHLQWDLSLDECIRIALGNRSDIRISAAGGEDGPITLTQVAEKPQSPAIFETEVENIVRQTAERYWELHRCWEVQETMGDARKTALSLWREVKAKQPVGAEESSNSEEAQARAHYHAIHEQLTHALSDVYETEASLRWLMRLNQHDGRLMRPSTTPDASERPIDWQAVRQEAIAKRAEIRAQRKRLKEYQRLQVAAGAETAAIDANAQEGTLGERLSNAKASHAALLAKREAAVMNDMELDASQQLGEAVRELDLAYGVLATNANRRLTAQDDVAAVQAVYDAGRASLDLLLQAQQRQADASCAYQRSLTDYQQAIVRLEKAKGTLLGSQGIGVSP